MHYGCYFCWYIVWQENNNIQILAELKIFNPSTRGIQCTEFKMQKHHGPKYSSSDARCAESWSAFRGIGTIRFGWLRAVRMCVTWIPSRAKEKLVLGRVDDIEVGDNAGWAKVIIFKTGQSEFWHQCAQPFLLPHFPKIVWTYDPNTPPWWDSPTQTSTLFITAITPPRPPRHNHILHQPRVSRCTTTSPTKPCNTRATPLFVTLAQDIIVQRKTITDLANQAMYAGGHGTLSRHVQYDACTGRGSWCRQCWAERKYV